MPVDCFRCYKCELGGQEWKCKRTSRATCLRTYGFWITVVREDVIDGAAAGAED